MWFYLVGKKQHFFRVLEPGIEPVPTCLPDWHRDRGESVSACVRDQRAALFHTQSRTTTYHVRWEEVAVAFDSVVENDDIGESGGETGGRAAFKAQAAPKAKLSPEHMEVGPTKFGGRFPRKY